MTPLDGVAFHPVTPSLSLDDFARLSIRLSEAGEARSEVLAEADLSEEDFEALEGHWADALDEAERAHGDGEGVPPLVEAYAAAFARAQSTLQTRAPMSFERYVAVTRELQRGADVTNVLEREGLPLSAFLESHRHWTRTMTEDLGLAQRFAALLAQT